MSAASERPPLGPASAAGNSNAGSSIAPAAGKPITEQERSAHTPAPSTGTSVTMIPTDAALVGEVVALVVEAKGKMQRAIDLLRARRERDPETFPAIFDEVMQQIEDRRRRSELRKAIADGRDIAAEAAARQAKRMAKLKAAAAADVRTHGQIPVDVATALSAYVEACHAEAKGDGTTKTMSKLMTASAKAQDDLMAAAHKMAYGAAAAPAPAPTVAQENSSTKKSAGSITAPFDAFKQACDALAASVVSGAFDEEDLAAAVNYLDRKVREVCTPERRLAAKGKRKRK